MRSAIIYCPHLNRDISGLLNAVPFPRIWTGQRTERGEDGCLQCHQAIVGTAKAKGWRRVFVMEDDCQFTRHFSWEKWLEAAEWVEEQGFDVLVGGSTRTYDEGLVRQGGPVLGLSLSIIEVSAFHSAHCIVYFKSGYDKILQTVQPFDYSIGRQGARVALVHPFVAVQRPSYSGILKQQVDYVPLYAAHEERLGRMFGVTA